MRAIPSISSGTFTVNAGNSGTVALGVLPTGVNSPQAVSVYNSASNWSTNAYVSLTAIFSAEL
jgi:hypothetical protein